MPILGVLVWMAPFSGWALAPRNTQVPDESRPQQAERLRAEYERAFSEGRYDEAASKAKRTCVIVSARHGEASAEFAHCINDVGVILQTKGEYGEAEPLLEQALATREKVLGTNHPDVAQSLNDLGSAHYMQGKYRKAEPLLERALAIREKVLGAAHPAVAESLNNLAMLHQAQGAYGKAESLYKRALTSFEKTLGAGHPNVAQILNNLASLYELQGAYGKAEPIFERALRIRERVLGVDHPLIAQSLSNLATLYEEQGAYSRADFLFERALEIRRKELGANHPDTALSLNNLAMLYHVQGMHGKAEPLLEQALEIWEKALGGAHPDVAQGLSNLASLYHDQKKYEKAELFYRRALSIKEKALGADHASVALSLNNLAILCEIRGAHGDAERLHERALGIFKETLGDEHPLVATSLSNLALLHHVQGSHDSALKMYHRALDIEEVNLARTLTVADESRRLAYALTLSNSMDNILSLHLGAAYDHGATAELALTTLLRRKNRVQDLATQSRAALRRVLPGDDRRLDDLSDIESRIAVLANRVPDQLGIEAHAQHLGELRQRRDRLWGELAEYRTLVGPLSYSATIGDVQQVLRSGSVLVEFAEYVPRYDADTRTWGRKSKFPARYAAYLIFPDHIDWVDLGPVESINVYIKSFRHALQTRQSIPAELHEMVIRPIVQKVGSAEHLIVAPAGDLSLIPFGALYDGKQYLIEKYNLHYVATGRDLLALPASPFVSTNPVTIVANPTGAHLPDAELEADFLVDLFRKTRVLLTDEATETNVRTIERPLVLHMATHGFLGKALNERDNPLFRSGLYLADVEYVEVDHERDNGELTAYEVSGMDLRGTQLVVLSACETGLGTAVKAEGKELMSEGVAGLRRAFAMAGARTTVMSLWEVSGVTAQKTMEAYYRKLAEGMGRGKAMQVVQLEMLRSEEHAHPKDWAAFIVSGDHKPMEFPEGEQPRVEELQGPPPVYGRPGCSVMAVSSNQERVLLGWLMVLLGFGAVRRCP